MREILATLPSMAKWKMENVLNELDDLAKEISRQNVKGAPGLLLVALRADAPGPVEPSGGCSPGDV